ncbi:unnamed protein product [Lampetra fluviatilis]
MSTPDSWSFHLGDVSAERLATVVSMTTITNCTTTAHNRSSCFDTFRQPSSGCQCGVAAPGSTVYGAANSPAMASITGTTVPGAGRRFLITFPSSSEDVTCGFSFF